MFRKLIALAVVSIAATAMAQNAHVEFTFGHGSAKNDPAATEPNAMFRFDARRMTSGDNSRMGGHFHISVRGRERTGTEIAMVRLNRLQVNVDQKTAAFSGDATITMHTPQGVRRARGVVIVEVRDSRAPDATDGRPDTIAVRFMVPNNENPAFAYRGVVHRGDIVVGQRREGR